MKTLTREGLAWLKSIETLRLKPYNDQTGDDITSWCEGATVGYGHLIPKSEWTSLQNGVTVEQAEKMLKEDLVPFEKAIVERVMVSLAAHQRDALICLIFNIGIGSFDASSVLKLVNDPKAKTAYGSLELAWKAWKRSQGKVMQGLVNRRAAEWRMYNEGVYVRW